LKNVDFFALFSAQPWLQRRAHCLFDSSVTAAEPKPRASSMFLTPSYQMFLGEGGGEGC